MTEWERIHRQTKEYKEQYPPGTRIVLNHMNDPKHPVPDGMRGTVDHVDDGANIHMHWDNGRTLALCPEDSFRKLTEEELKEEQRLAVEEYQEQQEETMQNQTM